MYPPPGPPIDPDNLRLPTSSTAPAKPRKRPPRHRQGERFLKGPIPWTWLDRAGRLPGKALRVALTLWQEAGFTKNRTVRLCLKGALPMRLNRQSARRGLRSLAGAGLVAVRSLPGRGLEITLRGAEADNQD